MGTEAKTVFLTGEDYSRERDPVDDELVNAAKSGSREGMIELTPDKLEEFAALARKAFDFYTQKIRAILTPERALFVKKCRVEQNATWRKVAHVCHDEWNENWDPPSNQIAGIVLCQLAMSMLGEVWPEEEEGQC